MKDNQAIAEPHFVDNSTEDVEILERSLEALRYVLNLQRAQFGSAMPNAQPSIRPFAPPSPR